MATVQYIDVLHGRNNRVREAYSQNLWAFCLSADAWHTGEKAREQYKRSKMVCQKIEALIERKERELVEQYQPQIADLLAVTMRECEGKPDLVLSRLRKRITFPELTIEGFIASQAVHQYHVAKAEASKFYVKRKN